MNEDQQKLYENFKTEGFLPIGPQSYPIFRQFDNDNLSFEKCSTIISSWSPLSNGLYKIIDEYVCAVFFFPTSPEYFSIFSPHGKEKSLQTIIDKLYEIAIHCGLKEFIVASIENRFLKNYENIIGYHIKSSFDQAESDHTYRMENLVCLDGTVNYYKRKRINLYCDREDIRLDPMTKQNVKLCLDIQKKWCDAKTDGECEICKSYFGCESKAISAMTDIFDENIHAGIIGYIGDTPMGYVITEDINKDVSFLHFGKGLDNDFFIYLIYMIYKTKINDFEYMNMGMDLGDPGLHFFKRKLSLSESWERYSCLYTKIDPKHGAKF
jgi:hypothetical protein